MEEPEWNIFQEVPWADVLSNDWTREGMRQLGVGQHLTIIGPENTILWSGHLSTLREGGFFRGKTIFPHRSGWHPKDVPLEVWQKWLVHQPPLRAELTTA
jgi:hypothetical protein